MNECPICKENTHWNLIDTRREDPLYECIHCKSVASQRVLFQMKLYQIGLARLDKKFPGAALHEISMTDFDLLTWLDPWAPQGIRSIQLETLNIQAVIDALVSFNMTWADTAYVLDLIKRLEEPDSEEIVNVSNLPYAVVSLSLTLLIQLGYIRQKEDTCDHCWRYLVC